MSDAYLDQCFYCYEYVHHSDEYLICSNKECEVVCHRGCYENKSDELFCCSNACVKKAGNGKKKKSKKKKNDDDDDYSEDNNLEEGVVELVIDEGMEEEEKIEFDFTNDGVEEVEVVTGRPFTGLSDVTNETPSSKKSFASKMKSKITKKTSNKRASTAKSNESPTTGHKAKKQQTKSTKKVSFGAKVKGGSK
jgi:hypothetical protein